jgi:hypothetical protein
VEEPQGPQVKPTLRFAALALLAVATLAGCVRLTSDTQVHGDDTFSQVAIIAANDDARAQLEAQAKVDLGDLKGVITSSDEYLRLSKDYPGQVAVEDYADGDLKGIKITGTNLPLDAFATSFAQFTSQLPFTGEASLVHTADTYVVSIPSGQFASLLGGTGVSTGALGLLSGSIDVSLTVGFPGLVTSATAGEIEGKTVTIGLTDLLSGKDITIVAASASQFYWKPWLMWGGIALAILVIIGGATALVMQDVRRHRTNSLPPPSPVVGTAGGAELGAQDMGPGVLPTEDGPGVSEQPDSP